MTDFVWPETLEKAKALQRNLKNHLIIKPIIDQPAYIAACDAAYVNKWVVGVACLFSFPELKSLDDAVSVSKCTFPYIPGYLTFREGPAIASAIEKLVRKPDLLLCDGQGIAHPLGMGIAAHLGVILGIASIGCAKSRLCGDYREPGRKKGSKSMLYSGKSRCGPGGEDVPIGTVLRTRSDVRPLFVSPGHNVDIEGAARIVLACTDRFRLPEPIRRAHRFAEDKAGAISRREMQ